MDNSHLQAAKRIWRYVSGTKCQGLLFTNNTCSSKRILGYSDSDWCNDQDHRKRTTGYIFKFCNTVISLGSKKQPIVALSVCEGDVVVKFTRADANEG